MRELALYAAVVAMCIALSTPVAFALDISQYEIVKREAQSAKRERAALGPALPEDDDPDPAGARPRAYRRSSG